MPAGGSYLDKLLLGLRGVDANGVPQTFRPILNFIGASIADNPGLGTTDIEFTGGSTVGAITGVESNGSLLPNEPTLNFVGFTVANDPSGRRTTIALPTIPVSSGGTGQSTLTAHAVLLGEGTSAVGFVAPASTAGYVLTSTGSSSDPTWQAAQSGALPAPGAPVSSNVTISGTGTWTLIQAVSGGYTITIGAITAGARNVLSHVGGAAGNNLLDATNGNPVTLSRGSNTFLIEDPQDRSAAPAASVTLRTSFVSYNFALDSTNNVLRSLGIA